MMLEPLPCPLCEMPDVHRGYLSFDRMGVRCAHCKLEVSEDWTAIKGAKTATHKRLEAVALKKATERWNAIPRRDSAASGKDIRPEGRVVEFLAPELVTIAQGIGRPTPWWRGMARKPAKCLLCHAVINRGQMSWRPAGGSRNRFQRIHDYCLKQLPRK